LPKASLRRVWGCSGQYAALGLLKANLAPPPTKSNFLHLPASPCGEPTGVEGFDEKLLLE